MIETNKNIEKSSEIQKYLLLLLRGTFGPADRLRPRSREWEGPAMREG
ncbi:MAG: hypothetical protein J6S97_03910 [Bacteroidales bacterium]|nr:hypothetical protein [Bacteroidales bacterium]